MQESKEVTFAPWLNMEIIEEFKDHAQDFARLMSYYTAAMMEIETKFKVLNIELNRGYDRNPIENIKTRLKSPRSIVEKMQRIGKPVTVDSIERELSDVAGVRVICSFVDDIYKLADMLALQDDICVLRVKDYIKNPKPSGYRSLHMIVEVPIFLSKEKRYMRVEVQLRTIAMDFWASLEHKLRYKKEIPESEKDYLQKELFECAQMINTLDQRMEAVKDRIAQKSEQ